MFLLTSYLQSALNQLHSTGSAFRTEWYKRLVQAVMWSAFPLPYFLQPVLTSVRREVFISQMALVLSAQTVLLLLLTALTIFTTASALPAKKTCGKNAQEDMDELILSIMPFGNPTVKPPTSVDDLPKFCR